MSTARGTGSGNGNNTENRNNNNNNHINMNNNNNDNNKKTNNHSNNSNNKLNNNANNVDYEFAGPYGCGLLILGLPFVIYFLYFSCNSNGCIALSDIDIIRLQSETLLAVNTRLISFRASCIYLAWIAIQVKK